MGSTDTPPSAENVCLRRQRVGEYSTAGSGSAAASGNGVGAGKSSVAASGGSAVAGSGAVAAVAPSESGADSGNQSYPGVVWDKVKRMWRVRVPLGGCKRRHVGYFYDWAQGAAAYSHALSGKKRGEEGGDAEGAEGGSGTAGLGAERLQVLHGSTRFNRPCL